jgi:hypothetical protein
MLRREGTMPDRRAGVRSAGAALPLLLLFLPKCPLCLLPYLAVLGAIFPPEPVLDALVGVTAAVWLLLLVRARPAWPALAGGLAGALLLLAGRYLEVPAVSAIGAFGMAALALTVRAGKLGASRGACTRGAPASRL